MRPRSTTLTRARLGVGLLGAMFAIGLFAAPSFAQSDGDAPPVDPDVLADTIGLYMSEFSNADFDGDGVADFADTDGDGIPNIPEGEPGDLDLTPGDGRFGTAIVGDVQASASNYVVDSDDGSMLLFDCGGMAISYDSNGNMVDWAIGVGSSEGGGPNGQLVDLFPSSEIGDRAFTKSNPFVVKDTVVYFGRMPSEGDGASNHTWSIDTAGISLDEGGDDNPDLNNRNAGEVSIGDDVPGGALVIPTGLYPIDGQLDSENGVRCGGSGWVKFDTAFPPLTAAGGVAAVLALAGIFGLLFNARPAITWKA